MELAFQDGEEEAVHGGHLASDSLLVAFILVGDQDIEHGAGITVAQCFAHKVEPTLAFECQFALTLLQNDLLQASSTTLCIGQCVGKGFDVGVRAIVYSLCQCECVLNLVPKGLGTASLEPISEDSVACPMFFEPRNNQDN